MGERTEGIVLPEFMIALLEASIAMTVIALVYIAITPLLSKKFTAKGRYYAWLVIIIGLIIPFRFHPQTSALYVDRLLPALKIANSHLVGEAVSSATTTSPVVPWHVLAGGLWISGVIVFITFHIIRHRRFLKAVRRWSTEIGHRQTLDILHDVQAKLGIKQQVDLRICPGISSPMLLGFIRPSILLPSDNIPKDELPFILKHELIHLKRGDVWYKALVFLATALHWFNPFVYIMAREISIQCEISCDEEVVKNTDVASRQKYVEAIIGVIRKHQVQSPFSTHFYSGRQGMKNRVFSIMEVKRKKWGISLLAVIIMATLSTGTVLALNAPTLASIIPTSTSNAEVGLGEGRPSHQLSNPIDSSPDVSESENNDQLIPYQDEFFSKQEIPMNDNSPRLIEDTRDKDEAATQLDVPKLFADE